MSICFHEQAGLEDAVFMKILRLHRWRVSPQKALLIQEQLRSGIRSEPLRRPVRLIAGADASFLPEQHLIKGAVCVLSVPELELIEVQTATLPLCFPYVPGLLTFREGPVLLRCFAKLKNTPGVILFDGQGIMHPRRMGIAAHLGILLNMPTIGCAKNHLYGTQTSPREYRGAYTVIKDDKEDVLGVCLRTRAGVKPVYVSPGNRMNLSDAIDAILQSTPQYRIPEPLRYAHAHAAPE